MAQQFLLPIDGLLAKGLLFALIEEGELAWCQLNWEQAAGRRGCLQPVWIDEIDRVVANVGVEVELILGGDRFRA